MQLEINLAGILAQSLEAPASVQLLERALDQPHLHRYRRHIGIFSGETVLYAMIIDEYGRHEPIFLTLPHLDSAAPWKKLRIILYPIHQSKHLLCAISKQDCFVNDRHRTV